MSEEKPPGLNFALVGAAGFVAPRHMQAIRDTGNRLVAAVDPHDSVGVLDRYAPEARFFTEIERFDRHLEKLRRREDAPGLHYVSICSPNYLHDAHVRLALRLGAHAICEKPLVINPWNLDQLAALEAETGRRVYTVLQLRHHAGLRKLHAEFSGAGRTDKADVVLTYITRRGSWYDHSWKGVPHKSGGLAMNLGVHFFDFLLWVFGDVEGSVLHLNQPRRMAGELELQHARVRWFLSVCEEDLPAEAKPSGRSAWRSLEVDGSALDLSMGFEDLHTRVYESILSGEGLGIDATRPSIELLQTIRSADVARDQGTRHPFLQD